MVASIALLFTIHEISNSSESISQNEITDTSFNDIGA